MPFAMTHLIIAENVYSAYRDNIGSLPQFYLGSIAPDAVRYRKDYVYKFKNDAHLYDGSEKWGMITDNEKWLDNAVNYMDKHRHSADADFVLGYCLHIIVDIFNNKTVWTPFRLKYPKELNKGYANMMHREHGKIDIELALTYENKIVFEQNIKKSASISLEGVIYAEEIEKHKNGFLNMWYLNKERQNVSANVVTTYEEALEFIKRAVSFAAPILDKYFYK